VTSFATQSNSTPDHTSFVLCYWLGECGLDYDRLQFCPAEVQRKYFALQLNLAQDLKLPLFLHMRAAADDFVQIVKANRHKFKHGVVRVAFQVPFPFYLLRLHTSLWI